MRLGATTRVLGRQLISPRNDGVRGSSPRVGSPDLQAFLLGAALLGGPLLCRGVYAGSTGGGGPCRPRLPDRSAAIVTVAVQQASPNPGGSASLTAVTALSATDVWALGSYGTGGKDAKALAEHWDGSSWQQVPIPTPPKASEVHLFGLAAVSPTDIWAVGSWAGVYTGPVVGYPYFALIEHWDGTSWTIVPSPSPGVSRLLSGVVAVSTNDIWAVGAYQFGYDHARLVGSRTLVLHWNGRTWKRVASPNPGPRQYQWLELSAIASISRTSVWAVGSYNARVRGRHGFSNQTRTLVLHWNGKTWKQAPSPTPGGSGRLSAVAAIGPKNVWAVGGYHNGYGGRVLAEYWNGHSWRIAPARTGFDHASYQSLNSLAVLARNDIWGVGSYSSYDTGDQTLSEHWDGQNWSLVPSPEPTPPLGARFSAVAAVTPTAVWAVGSSYPQG
jgi:hypothetical protein